jgi:hypothetical protein
MSQHFMKCELNERGSGKQSCDTGFLWPPFLTICGRDACGWRMGQPIVK